MTEVYHIPALLPQSIAALNIKPGGIYVDATLGGGGHTRVILDAIRGAGSKGHLYSFDRDYDAIERAAATIEQSDGIFTAVWGNFRYLRNFLHYYGVDAVDGILADLGVSFHHFDDAARGFSFRWDGDLDMRMNRNGGITAADVINNYPAERLAELFRLYGEMPNGRRIASAIESARSRSRITRIADLMEIIAPFIDKRKEKKELAKVFQALRIEVNDELGALKKFLSQALQCLRPGGRLAVITYHSLEDRLVKNFMKAGNFSGQVEQDFYGRSISPISPVGKPVAPDEQEIEANPRSRSARLRVAEKNVTDEQ